MLKKWLVSEGGECFPQLLYARQIGKQGREGYGNYYSKLLV